MVGSQTLPAVVSCGTWRVSVPTGLADGTYDVRATATDLAGNTGSDGTGNELTVDTAAPAVTIDRASGQADPTNESPILFSVVFTEPVRGFDEEDILLDGTAGATTAKVTGGSDGRHFDVEVRGMTQTGSVIATIPAGAAEDDAGNPTSAATPAFDNNVWYYVPFEAHFDFGTKTSPVATGYARVAETTTYSTTLGYGWTGGKILSADRGKKYTDLDRDLNCTQQGTFAVDVPNGEYHLTLRMGDMGLARDQMGVAFEAVPGETVSTKAKEIVTRDYLVWVDDGQLTVDLQDLGGKDKYVSIAALRVALMSETTGSATAGVDSSANATPPSALRRDHPLQDR